MTFTPHAKLPFKLGLGNFDYNGNTSLVLRIHYATSNKFLENGYQAFILSLNLVSYAFFLLYHSQHRFYWRR